MSNIRQPAVAGMFYPASPDQLRDEIETYLNSVQITEAPPKALIAPHAGYIYSGPIAASAYASLKPVADKIHKVVLLGPAHRVPFTGLAAPTRRRGETLDRRPVEPPLGPQGAVGTTSRSPSPSS